MSGNPRVEKLYSFGDIAKVLNISKKTVYNNWKLWKAEGRIQRVYRVGGSWRFPESDVKRLVDSFEV